MPHTMYRNAWRSTLDTVGYDMVQLNHYAVRSAESFLVKRDRGRVNHVDRDQGLAYWFRMNNNSVQKQSIQRMIPHLHAEMDRMLADPDIRSAHEKCIFAHCSKLDELRQTGNYSKFYNDLTGYRVERLSRMHHQQNAFMELFPKLKPGGLYIIEDLRWQPSMMEKEGITKTADLFAGFSKSQKFSHIDKDVEAELNALAPHISGCFVFQAQFDKKKRDQVAVIHKR
jgi:hypothetical protein